MPCMGLAEHARNDNLALGVQRIVQLDSFTSCLVLRGAVWSIVHDVLHMMTPGSRCLLYDFTNAKATRWN